MNAYDFSFERLGGGELNLSDLKGKVLLIVNTASECGFTPQYSELERLWREHRDLGLVVIGVPCNDFGNQEPGTAGQISEFCQTKFDVTFPLVGKSKVMGEDAHPFYLWARTNDSIGPQPRWNFHKYLVNRDGELVGSFLHKEAPYSSKVLDALRSELGG